MKETNGAIDHDRGSVTIPRRLMPTVLALQTGDGATADGLASLQASGIATDARLHPFVARLLAAMVDPTMVVTIDVDRRPLEPRLVTFWQMGSTAVAGVSEQRNLIHLTAVAPELLPFHVAAASGVRVVSQPAYVGGTTVDETSLQTAEETAGTAPAAAERCLCGGGMSRTWAERLTAALLLRRSKWDLDVVWLNSGGREHAALTVLDSGHAGYWTWVPTTDGRVRVTPVGIDQLLETLGSVLPPPGWIDHHAQPYD